MLANSSTKENAKKSKKKDQTELKKRNFQLTNLVSFTSIKFEVES